MIASTAEEVVVEVVEVVEVVVEVVEVVGVVVVARPLRERRFAHHLHPLVAVPLVPLPLRRLEVADVVDPQVPLAEGADDAREREGARVEPPRREHQRDDDEPAGPHLEERPAERHVRRAVEEDVHARDLEAEADVRLRVPRVELGQAQRLHLEAAAGGDVRRAAEGDRVTEVEALRLHREEREEPRA